MFLKFLKRLFRRSKPFIDTSNETANEFISKLEESADSIITDNQNKYNDIVKQFNESLNSNDNQNEKTSEVIIGFDFGSSSSKVIVNFNTFDKKYPIDFKSKGHPSNSYLLPTIIYIDKDGILSLEGDSSYKVIKDFKTRLRNNSEDYIDSKIKITFKELAIAYIGLVLRIVKNEILVNPDVPSKKISWRVNLGIPINSDKNKDMMKLFNEVACSAYYISELDKKIDKQVLIESRDKNNWTKIIGFHEDFIHVVPEIQAEVVSFVRSPQRKDGLYVLIDIGSRTLDISSFNLHSRDGEDKYPFLTADVDLLGTFYLHEMRLKKEILTLNGKEYIKNHDLDLNDSVAPLPKFSDYFINGDNSIDSNESEILKWEFHSIREFLIKTFVNIRKNKYPNAPEWSDGLPVFICGGGKNLDLYKEVIKYIENKYIKKLSKGDAHRRSCLILKELPISDDLSNIKGFQDRLAVANGLSNSFYDIGRINPPEDLPDFKYLVGEKDKQDTISNYDYSTTNEITPRGWV